MNSCFRSLDLINRFIDLIVDQPLRKIGFIQEERDEFKFSFSKIQVNSKIMEMITLKTSWGYSM